MLPEFHMPTKHSALLQFPLQTKPIKAFNIFNIYLCNAIGLQTWNFEQVNYPFKMPGCSASIDYSAIMKPGDDTNP